MRRLHPTIPPLYALAEEEEEKKEEQRGRGAPSLPLQTSMGAPLRRLLACLPSPGRLARNIAIWALDHIRRLGLMYQPRDPWS